MKKFISFIILISIVMFSSISFAENEIEIQINKDIIKKDEEFLLNIKISNTKIASFTLEIYFDMGKLEYINGPDNSNFSNNRVIYTWVDSKAKDNKEIEIKDFNFRALEDGIANIVTIVEAYDSNGNRTDLNNNYEIQIGEKIEQSKENIDVKNVSNDNTDLQIMRLDYEGISPEFNKDTKEYYFIADNSINKLEVTAIPENINSVVNITGNTNIKMGLNTINIEVISEDGSRKSNYKIYVTKTNNVEKANTNLETLAVRQGQMVPEFDNNVTKYKIEVSNDIQRLDILAIPENINAKTEVSSKDLQIGENNIEIVVIAEDGITRKKYEIIANRRSQEQEEKYNEEQNINAQRVEALLSENNINDIKIEEANKNDNKFVIIGIIVLVSILVVFIVLKKNSKNKK